MTSIPDHLICLRDELSLVLIIFIRWSDYLSDHLFVFVRIFILIIIYYSSDFLPILLVPLPQ